MNFTLSQIADELGDLNLVDECLFDKVYRFAGYGDIPFMLGQVCYGVKYAIQTCRVSAAVERAIAEMSNNQKAELIVNMANAGIRTNKTAAFLISVFS